jgi:hypothetical protein
MSMTKTNGNLKVMVPTFIPLAEAVHKYNLTEEVLTRLIRDGRIDGAQLPSGDLLVSDDGLNEAKTKEQIIKEEFSRLCENPVTVSEAENRYGLQNQTIRNWVTLGYIRVVDNDYPMKLDEADVAYCAKIYHERGGRPGARIFDSDGNPYQLKHPELAEYRRHIKKSGKGHG